jgi:GNAT superfamily N-acetyltransferase
VSGTRRSAWLNSDPVDIVLFAACDVAKIKDDVVAVYSETFRLPPYLRSEDDVRDFAESFARHAGFAGFRGVVARSGSEGQVVGFTYGYALAPGQWWYERVASQLSPGQAETTMRDAFLLTQLAVLPAFQGRGIGGRLHDALLDGVPQSRALLSTRQEDSPARHLYLRRGWRALLRDAEFPGAHHPYQILERSLPTTNDDFSRGSRW